MHEFVLSGGPMKRELKLKTLDLAKRLLDFGFHPPTVYFPLLVDEALMVEPTETETRETLDAFAEAIAAILREAATEGRRSRRTPPTRPRSGAWTRSRRRSARSSVRRWMTSHTTAHLLRHPAHGLQAPGQLHRRDRPVRRRAGPGRGAVLHRRPARDHRLRMSPRGCARACMTYRAAARRRAGPAALHPVPSGRRAGAHRAVLAAERRDRAGAAAADAPVPRQVACSSASW